MAPQPYGQPKQMPDGTYEVLLYDAATGQFTTQRIGNAVDPVAAARQAGQASAAQTSAIYGDPWYAENVLAPMNRSTEQAASDRATQLKNQARQLELQGRTAEAQILNQKAAIELRKAELRQSDEHFYAGQGAQRYQFDRGQQLSANLALGQMRGPGNAAQFIDSGRRLGSMGIQSTALGEIAAGGTATGAFVPGGSMKPVSMADRMSGLLGVSEDTINQRDVNDRGLARQIYSKPGQLARGSLESLSPYERGYLSSYGESEGYSDEAFEDAYQRAGIHQGRR